MIAAINWDFNIGDLVSGPMLVLLGTVIYAVGRRVRDKMNTDKDELKSEMTALNNKVADSEGRVTALLKENEQTTEKQFEAILHRLDSMDSGQQTQDKQLTQYGERLGYVEGIAELVKAVWGAQAPSTPSPLRKDNPA